jgi:biofilm PGA synthesis lipoprotein PgaB
MLSFKAAKTLRGLFLFMPLVLCVSLLGYQPVAAQEKPGRLLAAQFMYIEATDYKQLEQTLVQLKQVGVNTIILRVFQNMGDRYHKLAQVKSPLGVYFKTKHAPLVDDLLTPIGKLAHEHGLKLFALMTTLRCDWKISEEPDWQAKGYDLGHKAIHTIPRLDPFKRSVRYYLADLYRDLAAQEIDGILIQDDLILRNTEGFGTDAQAVFQQEMKSALVPNELFKGVRNDKKRGYVVNRYTVKFWDWSEWKNKHLLKLARSLMDNVRRVNPKLKFAINLYYETVVEPSNALAWFSQDLKAALGYDFDYYALMAYHRQMKKELYLDSKLWWKIYTDTIQEMGKMVGDTNKIWLKFQIRDWDTGQQIPVAELEQVLQIISQIKDAHLAYVPHEGQAPLELIKKYYK